MAGTVPDVRANGVALLLPSIYKDHNPDERRYYGGLVEYNPSPGPATGRIYARSYPMKKVCLPAATSGCLLNTHFVMQRAGLRRHRNLGRSPARVRAGLKAGGIKQIKALAQTYQMPISAIRQKPTAIRIT